MGIFDRISGKSGVKRMMPRKAIWLFGSLLVIAVLSLSFPMAKGQEGTPTGTVGVEVGDWVKFRTSALSYESNIPGYEEPPVWFKVIGPIEWFICEVIEVSKNNVTFQIGVYYEDGTKQFETLIGDPIAGSGNLSNILAPAGIGQSDQFYIWLEEWGYLGPRTVTIKETISRTYAGESREVNHVTISLPHPEGGNHNFKYYFDKEMGICCDQLLSYSYEGVRNGIELYLKYSWSLMMTETNMWGAAEALEKIQGSATREDLEEEASESVTISGTIIHGDYSQGEIFIGAYEKIYLMPPRTIAGVEPLQESIGAVSIWAPGTYSFQVPVNSGEVWVAAINDANNDGVFAVDMEPAGKYIGNPLIVGMEDIENVNVTLQEGGVILDR